MKTHYFKKMLSETITCLCCKTILCTDTWRITYGVKEIINRVKNRKSIVTIKTIKKGEKFTIENIDIKRPGYGIEPKYFDVTIGKMASRDIDEDEVLEMKDAT